MKEKYLFQNLSKYSQITTFVMLIPKSKHIRASHHTVLIMHALCEQYSMHRVSTSMHRACTSMQRECTEHALVCTERPQAKIGTQIANLISYKAPVFLY